MPTLTVSIIGIITAILVMIGGILVYIKFRKSSEKSKSKKKSKKTESKSKKTKDKSKVPVPKKKSKSKSSSEKETRTDAEINLFVTELGETTKELEDHCKVVISQIEDLVKEYKTKKFKGSDEEIKKLTKKAKDRDSRH